MTLVTARSQQQEDNARVRVTHWTLPPNSETGHHVHEYDYVIVPVTDGTLTILTDGGETVAAPLQAGISYFRPAGVSHNVTNRGNEDIVFLEVELKQPG